MSKELSLDDIIQKKKTSIAMKNRGIKKPVTKNATKTANGASNHLKVSKRIEDARLKIIQIKRNHMVDARDKLAQMARLSDARLKLQKLRAARSKKVDPVSMSRKTGCTGQISLSTNKLTVPRIPRTVSSFVPLHSRPLNYRPTMIPEAHYVNEMIVGYNNDYLMDHQAALRRTVSNDYAPSLPPPPPIFNIKPSPYDWDKPTHGSSLSRSQSIRTVDQSRPRDYKVITRTGLPKSESGHVYRDDWAFSSKTRTILPDSALNSKYYAMRSHKGDVGVKSRLESHPSKASRLTVNSSRSKSSSQTPGYRIVVSNLQPNVTQEDIKVVVVFFKLKKKFLTNNFRRTI
ncbi:uncharacterized protein LOC106640740 isoform X2 [Copidosoma floridanum]|uniref:uncharacterized protein LOC106640740 isoform X2 n=1 Tax=Copidosoma floridanum TaxID=29053 RepID=UPI0006C98DB5|nr:uncharacterized protein LOC106640740 isoform X2 [Copidosoma floridanum]